MRQKLILFVGVTAVAAATALLPHASATGAGSGAAVGDVNATAAAVEAAAQPQDIGRLVEDGIQAHDVKKIDAAAAMIDAELQKPDANQAVYGGSIQNIAQFYQLDGQPAKSLHWWQKLTKAEPDNWRALSKIVQCAQALGLLDERDAARAKLIAMNAAGKVNQRMFCREQFKFGDTPVMVMEYFKPEGKTAVEMAFLMMSKTEPPTVLKRYTFGELVSDTQIAREMKTIGPDEHMYSIDGFTKERQWLVFMLKKKPTYEKLRELIVADMGKNPS